MKSERTIKNWIRTLQKAAEREKTPSVESRIAYFSYHLLRRVVEDVKWNSITDDLEATARLIRREMENDQHKTAG